MKANLSRKSVSSTVRIEEDKKVIAEKHDNQQIGDPVSGKHLGYIRVVVPLKLSFGFNSAGLEIGVEIPFECEPGDVQKARKYIDEAYELVGDVLSSKTPDITQLLDGLKQNQKRKPY